MKYVFILVHGTWGKKSRWTFPGSRIHKSLLESFPSDEVIIERFGWSGSNLWMARIRAGEKLRDFIKEKHEQHPDADRYIVISHSHGATVTQYALRSQSDVGLIDSVVCISTPFLHLAPRPTWPANKLTLFMSVFIGVGMSVTFLDKWLGLQLDNSTGACMTLFAIAGCIVGGLFMLSREYERGDLYRPPPFPMRDVLVMRAPRDEASGVLVWTQFSNWFISKAWRFFERPISWLSNNTVLRLLEPVERVPMALVVLVGIGIMVFVGGMIDNVGPSLLGTSWDYLKYPAWTIYWLLIACFAITLSHYLMAALYIPIVIIQSILSLGFGVLNPFTAIIYDISAEPVPEGSCTVYQIPAWDSDSPHDTPRPGLLHSAVYDDPASIRYMIYWIKGLD